MSEKYLGENSTPLLINQIKENCTQKRSTLPIPSIDELGNTYQYTGTTSGSLVHGYFYECVSDGQDPATYSWQNVSVQPVAGTPTAQDISFDNTTTGVQATNVQDELVDLIRNKQNIIQINPMPTASATELGKVYQYVGADDAVNNLTHGYFYECTYDGTTLEYSWTQTNVQPHINPTASNISYDNTTSGLTADDVQEAIDEVEGRIDTAESDIDNIEALIPQDTSTTNMLVNNDSLGTAAFKGFTPNVAPNNHNLVESNAVYNAITTALTSVYTPRGDLTCAELTSALLIAANVGNIYEMSDSGITTNLFLQGAGETIHVGDNVGIIQTGEDTYKFNLMANAFDLTDYQKKDLTTPITVDGVQKTTVEDALGGLNTAISGRLQEIGALPTASVDNLHKTYLLISTQTGYDKGAIYQCQSDGQDPATYSWVKISSADVPIATTSVAGIVKPDGNTIDVDANGEISVIGIGDEYKKIWIGHKADWDLLSLAEKTEYDEAHFDDDEGSEAETDVYSTTETKTNKVWIDGKPIYRKVVNTGALPNNTTVTVQHGISNIDFVVDLRGMAKNPTSGIYRNLPRVATDDVSSQIAIGFNNTAVSIACKVDLSAYTSSYMIIEYTKTTDG